ncbi:MAG: 50S ribosomal protein L21, partial [Clostridia bacterium]
IVKSGGKQYRVSEGEKIKVEKLENAVKEKINLDVLLVSNDGIIKTGSPVLKDVVCTAEVVSQGKGEKLVIFKYKAKKNVRKKQGHRQPYTELKILEIK